MLLPSDFRNGTRNQRWRGGTTLVLVTAAASLLAVSSGCGGGGGGKGAALVSPSSAASRSASLTVSLDWPDPTSLVNKGRAFPVAANSLSVTITDSTGFSSTQVLVRPPVGSANTTATANFFALSPGQATITALAFASQDGTGPVLSRATSSLVLQTGQQTGVTLDFPSPVASIAVTPAASTVLRGSLVKIFANATDDRGNTSTAMGTFATSDPAVATVDAAGNVTGVSIGTAVITFTDGTYGKSGQATISVLGITQITLTPANYQIVPGATVLLSAVGKDANGVIQQFNPTGTWASANPNIATVDGAGNVTGVSAGSTTISFTDTVFGITGTTTISVRGGDAQVTIQ